MFQLPLVSNNACEEKTTDNKWQGKELHIMSAHWYKYTLCPSLTYYKPFISTAALLEDVNMHEFVDTWLLLPLIHTLSMFAFWIQHPVLLRHCENSNTSLQHALFDVTTSNLVNFIFNYLSLSLAFHRSSEPDAENAVNTLFEELAYRQNDGKRVNLPLDRWGF